MCGVPEERLSPHSLPTPCCPLPHQAVDHLLCGFLINSLSQRQSFGKKQLILYAFGGGLMWAQRSMLGGAGANTYPDLPSSQATTDPHDPPNPPESACDTTMATGMRVPQASFKTPSVCGKVLQEPKALLMSCFFVSLLCWYLGQHKNKRTQIFHRLLIQGFQSTHLYLSYMLLLRLQISA